jgi:LytS/YehU family sensor histidine kinase
MVLKLSEMMRYSIYEGQNDEVLLQQELAYLKNYIELQEIRYHKKSDVRFNHQIEGDAITIMPLLFINLVENAFKHGLENMAEHAYIHINLSADKNEINFEVENNFELSKNGSTKGIGLENLKRRLDLVYPKRHSLTIEKGRGIYKVKLSLNKK